MAKICEFTGIEIPEGSDTLIKKMCLNCKSMAMPIGEGVCTCVNESVMEKGKEKLIAALPEGFEIETLTLKPMTLKNPTKKCAFYECNFDLLLQQLKDTLS